MVPAATFESNLEMATACQLANWTNSGPRLTHMVE